MAYTGGEIFQDGFADDDKNKKILKQSLAKNKQQSLGTTETTQQQSGGLFGTQQAAVEEEEVPKEVTSFIEEVANLFDDPDVVENKEEINYTQLFSGQDAFGQEQGMRDTYNLESEKDSLYKKDSGGTDFVIYEGIRNFVDPKTGTFRTPESLKEGQMTSNEYKKFEETNKIKLVQSGNIRFGTSRINPDETFEILRNSGASWIDESLIGNYKELPEGREIPETENIVKKLPEVSKTIEEYANSLGQEVTPYMTEFFKATGGLPTIEQIKSHVFSSVANKSYEQLASTGLVQPIDDWIKQDKGLTDLLTAPYFTNAASKSKSAYMAMYIQNSGKYAGKEAETFNALSKYRTESVDVTISKAIANETNKNIESFQQTMYPKEYIRSGKSKGAVSFYMPSPKFIKEKYNENITSDQLKSIFKDFFNLGYVRNSYGLSEESLSDILASASDPNQIGYLKLAKQKAEEVINNSFEDENNWKENFANGFKYGDVEMLPVVAPMVSLSESRALKDVITKQENDEKLTMAEELLLNSAGNYNTFNAIHPDSFWYEMGRKVVPQSLGFVADYIMTSGVGTSQRVAAEAALTNFSKNLLRTKSISKFSGAAIKSVSTVYEHFLVRVPLSRIDDMLADIEERLLPVNNYYFDNETNAFYNKVSHVQNETYFEAAVKSYLQEGFGSLTEALGGGLVKAITKPIGKVTSPVVAAMSKSLGQSPKVVRGIFDFMAKNRDFVNRAFFNFRAQFDDKFIPTPENIALSKRFLEDSLKLGSTKLLKASGTHSFPAEYLEEFINNRIAPLIEGHEDPLFEDFGGTLLNEVSQTAVALVPIVGISHVMNSPAYLKSYKYRNSQDKKLFNQIRLSILNYNDKEFVDNYDELRIAINERDVTMSDEQMNTQIGERKTLDDLNLKREASRLLQMRNDFENGVVGRKASGQTFEQYEKRKSKEIVRYEKILRRVENENIVSDSELDNAIIEGDIEDKEIIRGLRQELENQKEFNRLYDSDKKIKYKYNNYSQYKNTALRRAYVLGRNIAGYIHGDTKILNFEEVEKALKDNTLPEETKDSLRDLFAKAKLKAARNETQNVYNPLGEATKIKVGNIEFNRQDDGSFSYSVNGNEVVVNNEASEATLDIMIKSQAKSIAPEDVFSLYTAIKNSNISDKNKTKILTSLVSSSYQALTEQHFALTSANYKGVMSILQAYEDILADTSIPQIKSKINDFIYNMFKKGVFNETVTKAQAKEFLSNTALMIGLFDTKTTSLMRAYLSKTESGQKTEDADFEESEVAQTVTIKDDPFSSLQKTMDSLTIKNAFSFTKASKANPNIKKVKDALDQAENLGLIRRTEKHLLYDILSAIPEKFFDGIKSFTFGNHKFSHKAGEFKLSNQVSSSTFVWAFMEEMVHHIDWSVGMSIGVKGNLSDADMKKITGYAGDSVLKTIVSHYQSLSTKTIMDTEGENEYKNKLLILKDSVLYAIQQNQSLKDLNLSDDVINDSLGRIQQFIDAGYDTESAIYYGTDYHEFFARTLADFLVSNTIKNHVKKSSNFFKILFNASNWNIKNIKVPLLQKLNFYRDTFPTESISELGLKSKLLDDIGATNETREKAFTYLNQLASEHFGSNPILFLNENGEIDTKEKVVVKEKVIEVEGQEYTESEIEEQIREVRNEQDNYTQEDYTDEDYYGERNSFTPYLKDKYDNTYGLLGSMFNTITQSRQLTDKNSDVFVVAALMSDPNYFSLYFDAQELTDNDRAELANATKAYPDYQLGDGNVFDNLTTLYRVVQSDNLINNLKIAAENVEDDMLRLNLDNFVDLFKEKLIHTPKTDRAKLEQELMERNAWHIGDTEYLDDENMLDKNQPIWILKDKKVHPSFIDRNYIYQVELKPDAKVLNLEEYNKHLTPDKRLYNIWSTVISFDRLQSNVSDELFEFYINQVDNYATKYVRNLRDVNKELADKFIKEVKEADAIEGIEFGYEKTKLVSLYVRKAANIKVVSKEIIRKDDEFWSEAEALTPKDSEEEDEKRFAFIGESGAARLVKLNNTANNLDVAKKMLESKLPMKKIYLATGWYKDGDAKWKMEISDYGAEINFGQLERLKNYGVPKDGGIYQTKLEAVLFHEELYEAYPEFKDINVFIDERSGNLGAAYLDTNMMSLNFSFYDNISKDFNNDFQDNEDYIKSMSVRGISRLLNNGGAVKTILHEIQHFIQKKEGFGSGANLDIFQPTMSERIAGFIKKVPATVKYYKNTSGEIESRNVESRIDMEIEERLKSFPTETEDVSEESKLYIIRQTGKGISILKPETGEVERVVPEGEKIRFAFVENLYHGTFQKFDKFDKEKLGSNTGAQSAQEGFFFATSRITAESYITDTNLKGKTLQKRLDEIEEKLTSLTGKNIDELSRALYAQDIYGEKTLSGESLKLMRERDKLYEKITDLYDQQDTMFGRNSEISPKGTLLSVVLEIHNPFISEDNDQDDLSYTKVIKEAKEKGHDSVIIKNTVDVGDGNYMVDEMEETDLYIVFEPEQIIIKEKFKRKDIIERFYNQSLYDSQERGSFYGFGTSIDISNFITLVDNAKAQGTYITPAQMKTLIQDIHSGNIQVTNPLEYTRTIVAYYKDYYLRNRLNKQAININKKDLTYITHTPNRTSVENYQKDIDLIEKVVSDVKFRNLFLSVQKRKKDAKSVYNNSKHKNIDFYSALRKLTKVNPKLFTTMTDLQEFHSYIQYRPGSISNADMEAYANRVYAEHLKEFGKADYEARNASEVSQDDMDEVIDTSNMIINSFLPRFNLNNEEVREFLEIDLSRLSYPELKEYYKHLVFVVRNNSLEFGEFEFLQRMKAKELYQNYLDNRQDFYINIINEKTARDRWKDVLLGFAGGHGNIKLYGIHDLMDLIDNRMTGKYQGMFFDAIAKPMIDNSAKHDEAMSQVLDAIEATGNIKNKGAMNFLGIYSLLHQRPHFNEVSNKVATMLNDELSSTEFIEGDTLTPYETEDIRKQGYELLRSRAMDYLKKSIIVSLGGAEEIGLSKQQANTIYSQMNIASGITRLMVSNKLKALRKYRNVESGTISELVEDIFNLQDSDLTYEEEDYLNRAKGVLKDIRSGVFSDGLTLDYAAKTYSGKRFQEIEEYVPVIRHKDFYDMYEEENVANVSGIDVAFKMASHANINDEFVLSRIDTISALEINLNKMVRTRADQQLFYLYNAKFGRFLKKLTASGLFKEGAPDESFNNNTAALLIGKINNYFQRGFTPQKLALRKSKFGRAFNEGMNNLKALYTGAFWKAPAQLSSIIAAGQGMAGNGAKIAVDLMWGFKTAQEYYLDDNINNFLKSASPEVYYRGLGDYDLNNSYTDSLFKKYSGLIKDTLSKGESYKEINESKFRKFALGSVIFFDKMAAVSSWFAAYRNHLTSNGKSFDINLIDQEAADFATNLVANTQASDNQLYRGASAQGIGIGSRDDLNSYKQQEFSAFSELIRQSYYSFLSFSSADVVQTMKNRRAFYKGIEDGDVSATMGAFQDMLFNMTGKLAFHATRGVANLLVGKWIIGAFGGQQDEDEWKKYLELDTLFIQSFTDYLVLIAPLSTAVQTIGKNVEEGMRGEELDYIESYKWQGSAKGGDSYNPIGFYQETIDNLLKDVTDTYKHLTDGEQSDEEKWVYISSLMRFGALFGVGVPSMPELYDLSNKLENYEKYE